jgi:HEAT repeat protein
MDRPTLSLSSLESLHAWAAPEAVARLGALADALPTCGDPERLEALARALPAAVSGLEPEVCLALASVAAALVPHGPVIPRDVAELEPRLRVAWRRIQLAAGDAVALAWLDELDEQELLRIVHGWSVDSILDPLPLARRLAAARDARLRMLLLDWILPIVRQLAATPAEAFAVLLPLVQDEDPTIRTRTLAMLGEGWLRGLSPVAERERGRVLVDALADAEASVVRAAIASVAALGRRDWLLPLVLDDERQDLARAEGLDALAPLAQAEDLDVALTLAVHEPLRFGPPARRFLLAAHRHGVFVRSQHLPALLELFDTHPGWTGEELVRVTYIVRAELVEQLAELPADDPRWIRRASILAASVGTRAPAVLRDRLEHVRDLAVARAFVEAAGHSPEYEGEEPLLTWLDALPEAVVPVLRVKGGAQAQARLHARVEDPRCGPAERSLAMGVLWALCRDRTTLLRELGTRLGPHDAGLLDGAYLEHRDPRIARLVVDPPWEDAPHHVIEPLRRFELLCESGDIELLPKILELYRELFRGYVRRALAGDFIIKRVALPELEQQLFRYGRHLVKAGRGVRRFLEPGPETGRDLVLQVALDWLREEPTPAVCVALLELVGRHSPGGAMLRLVEPFWRHGDREVRRAAIEAILAAGEGARGLELSICRLAEHEEPRIMVQALAAVGTLGAQWAEPMVLAALRRPEMAIKKEAAHALAQVGSERSVAPLVEWLAHHDNRGFRSELHAALRRAAGPSLVAVLVDALASESEPRRIELLWDALSGHLPLAAALRLARSACAWHQGLLEACLDGRVALADADAERLASQLHRAKLLPQAPRKDPGRRLRIEGFSRQAARELVELRTPALEGPILATVRAGLADWVAWLRADDVDDPQVLALVLDAAQPQQHAEHVGTLLELALRWQDTVDPGAVAGWLERAVAGQPVGRAHEVRAIGLLRRLPPSAHLGGLRRHRLLGRLGAVRTQADLERCLDECRMGPEHARDAATLLCEALRIPTATEGEPPERTAMREMAERWHACEPAARMRWLVAMLAARPLDVDVVEPLAAPAKPRFTPSSQADLEALQATLREGDEQERSRAAARLLDWPDAAFAWPGLLDAFLQGRVMLGATHLARLAPLLTDWPNHPIRAGRAAAELLPYCTPWQHRGFVHTWVERWAAGDATMAAELLRATRESLLLPHVWAAAERGDFRLMELLRPSDSLALRTLVAWVGSQSPAAVEHLRVRVRDEPPPADDAADPDDPIAGREPDELVAIILQKGVAKGLAVRAVHALVAHGERGVAPLEQLVVDPRPPVRSAALRALRQATSRERTLQATARALAMETRRDVVLQLMKSLGHGRHEPSLPALLERLDHGDVRIRQGAHAAIRAWGHEVVPALRRAARRARPDRRPAYTALITELEQIDT